jgi:hypothetical protein
VTSIPVQLLDSRLTTLHLRLHVLAPRNQSENQTNTDDRPQKTRKRTFIKPSRTKKLFSIKPHPSFRLETQPTH